MRSPDLFPNAPLTPETEVTCVRLRKHLRRLVKQFEGWMEVEHSAKDSETRQSPLQIRLQSILHWINQLALGEALIPEEVDESKVEESVRHLHATMSVLAEIRTGVPAPEDCERLWGSR